MQYLRCERGLPSLAEKPIVPRPMRPKETAVHPKEPTVRICANDWIDRGTSSGFEKYMKENPVYFRHLWPASTIREAWKEVKRL
jgi:hypothetical protein